MVTELIAFRFIWDGIIKRSYVFIIIMKEQDIYSTTVTFTTTARRRGTAT